MKTYCVVYSVTTSYDAAVKAKTREEAVAKVREVIGEPVTIESVWETKEKVHA